MYTTWAKSKRYTGALLGYSFEVMKPYKGRSKTLSHRGCHGDGFNIEPVEVDTKSHYIPRNSQYDTMHKGCHTYRIREHSIHYFTENDIETGKQWARYVPLGLMCGLFEEQGLTVWMWSHAAVLHDWGNFCCCMLINVVVVCGNSINQKVNKKLHTNLHRFCSYFHASSAVYISGPTISSSPPPPPVSWCLWPWPFLP